MCNAVMRTCFQNLSNRVADYLQVRYDNKYMCVCVCMCVRTKHARTIRYTFFFFFFSLFVTEHNEFSSQVILYGTRGIVEKDCGRNRGLNPARLPIIVDTNVIVRASYRNRDIKRMGAN